MEAEPGRPDEQRSLVRPQSWQRQRLAFENHVDAMALVRRSAWESVGGYTHIEGGWEDYDFWCKLVEKLVSLVFNAPVCWLLIGVIPNR